MLVMLGFATFNHWDVSVLKLQIYYFFNNYSMENSKMLHH